MGEKFASTQSHTEDVIHDRTDLERRTSFSLSEENPALWRKREAIQALGGLRGLRLFTSFCIQSVACEGENESEKVGKKAVEGVAQIFVGSLQKTVRDLLGKWRERKSSYIFPGESCWEKGS